VSKVWLQKELILVGFWLSQVGWIGFFCLGSKIGEKVQSWFLSNLDGSGPSTSPHASPPKGRFGPTLELLMEEAPTPFL